MSQLVPKVGSVVSARRDSSTSTARTKLARSAAKAFMASRAITAPVWRELHALRMPVEQRHAELLLELPHVITHRSRGCPEFGRGLREAARARGAFERADGGQRRQLVCGHHKFALAYVAVCLLVNAGRVAPKIAAFIGAAMH